MDLTLINSIIKEQYKVIDKDRLIIDIRGKHYTVCEVLNIMSSTIDSIKLNMERIMTMYDIYIEEEANR